MVRNVLFFSAVLFLVVPCWAMFEENGVGVRPEGMAGAFTAVADDVSAASFNPAGLFQVGKYEVQGFYKLLYGGAGVNLHSVSAAGCMPLGRFGSFGLSAQETGFELHSERTLKFTHGLRLVNSIGFGYGLNVYNLFQKGIGSGFSFGLDLGMFARVYRVWTTGFYVHNINMPRIGTGPEGEMPRSLCFGLGYSPTSGIHSAIDLEKEPGKGTQVRCGQEFTIVPDHLVLRAGVQTEPVSFAFGLRTGTRSIHIDYALKTHAELGLTHNFGLSLGF
ncbi:hypothetical protein CH330_03890 [candidate division WOR-3 bacterium JGI_Cruoil_03_51_56]|uniref:PorV/PorQ family protein n=1 Tax=candidate division WOR-3 bacterium JGI_Cruoil_03_51_56 TaxID=1973747 RepID=A0A235BW91_UNCW3|nr:MAG: hypothetical protein CH330_03890 [candidate division WOR-3 bacterium JGI_Cruoil_03_51_56]